MRDRIARRLALAIAAISAGCRRPRGRALRHRPARRRRRRSRAGTSTFRRTAPDFRPGAAMRGRARRSTNEKCASCHGAHGEGKPMDRLVGGFGTVFDVKTGKNCRKLLALRDHAVRLCSPRHAFDAPQSLTPDQVYAVCAYVLFLNGLVAAGRDARRRDAAEDRDAQPGPFRQRRLRRSGTIGRSNH